MLLVRTYLAQSSIHGVGLFAAEDIPSGTVIWEFTPHLDISIGIATVKDGPSHIKEFLSHYGFIPHENPTQCIVCMDNARFINHSEFANTDDTTGFTIAKRDIKKGEEIVSNYAEFDAEFAAISERYSLPAVQSVAKTG
jgi:hypothetical protein